MMVGNIDIFITGCVLLTILNYKFLNKKEYLYLGVLLTVTGLYIKTSLFISLFLIWVGFSVYLIIKKEFKQMLWVVTTGVVFLFLTGCYLFGSTGGIINFIVNNIVIALNYSDQLSLYPDNSWLPLGICLGCVLLIMTIFIRQPGGFLINISILCLFSAWKYSIGREDMSHAMYFDCLLMLFMILFLTLQKKNAHIGLLLFLSAICFYNFNLQHLSDYKIDRYGLPTVINFNDRVVNHHAFKQQMEEESKQACAVNLLPESWRKTIGKHTTDIFPWDLSIIMINGLSYQPRPSVQSIGMGMKNDLADASSFKSAAAPHYIIWHATKGDKTNIDGIDNQYLPNTCPQTFEAIISNYRLTTMANEKFAVWERQPATPAIQKQMIGSSSVSWGTWIDLPTDDSINVVKARVDYKNTMLYGLRSFFYKGLPVYIEYVTDSGKVLKYAFSKQCSLDGIFVNPLWIDNQLHFINIKRIRFLNEDGSYYSANLNVTLEKLAIPKP